MQDGAEIPRQIIEASDTKKRNRKKTLTQLPVYRASANLMFVLFSVMMSSPRKATKFLDLMLDTTNSLMTAIGMADKARSLGERVSYIDAADVMVRNLGTYIKALNHAKVYGHQVNTNGRLQKLPVVSKCDEDKISALIKSIVSQLVAWRGYTMNEGVNANLKE